MAAKKAVIAPDRIVARKAPQPIEVPVTIEASAPLIGTAELICLEATPDAPATDIPHVETAPVHDIAAIKTKDSTTMENAIKSTEEIVSFGQGNVEAIMKSGQIWATGVQDLGKHFAATAQAHLDETMATVKALSSVKSLKEAMDIQSSLTKTAVEKLLAETGKLTDASMKLAEQTMAPITARVTLATEKFGRTA